MTPNERRSVAEALRKARAPRIVVYEPVETEVPRFDVKACAECSEEGPVKYVGNAAYCAEDYPEAAK